MEIKDGQFTTLPDAITDSNNISVDDVIVYLMIKKNMNDSTRMATRSYETLSKECELTVYKIKQCLQRLEDAGYISITYNGIKRANSYFFPVDKEIEFEMIALAFISNPNLTAREKGLLAILQKDMKVDKDTQTGLINLSYKEILDKANVSKSMLSRIESGLTEKDVYTKLTSSAIDEVTKLHKDKRLTDIDKTRQADTLLAENIDAMKIFMGTMFRELLHEVKSLRDDVDDIRKQSKLKPTPNVYKFDSN